MRLINAETLEFEEVTSQNAEYAIISHRWGDDEVSYQDFLRDRDGARTGSGWQKITEGCRLARQFRYRWLWIDTSCINKESSVELSEAINSMYRWYERAAVCYVFLPDVASTSDLEGAISVRRPYTLEAEVLFYEDQFISSGWFTRGWTLQELLAPQDVLFMNANYGCIGSRTDLADLLSEVTGINVEYFTKGRPVGEASIAERFGWAAERETSKEEDIAYSLLGIFDVNMPLLYGEGSEKAFTRLQLEIIKKSDDESIFAWTDPRTYGTSLGLLAPSPSFFALPNATDGSKLIASAISPGPLHQYRHPYNMTNKGLELILDVPCTNVEGGEFQFDKSHRSWILLPLNCKLICDGEPADPLQWPDDQYSQLALLLRVVVGLEAEVLFADRLHPLLQGDIRNPQNFDIIFPTGGRSISLPKECAVVGAARPIKRWKVYVEQKGS